MDIKIEQWAPIAEIEEDILDSLGFAASSCLISLLHTTSDCVKLLTREGRLRYANARALEELAQATLEQARDRIWSEFWPAAARPILEEAVDKASAGHHVHCEVPRPDEDGDRLWSVALTPVTLRDGTVEAILVVSSDLTANTNARPS